MLRSPPLRVAATWRLHRIICPQAELEAVGKARCDLELALRAQEARDAHQVQLGECRETLTLALTLTLTLTLARPAHQVQLGDCQETLTLTLTLTLTPTLT